MGAGQNGTGAQSSFGFRGRVSETGTRKERAAAGGNLVEGDPSVSSRTPQASVQAAQSIARGDNQLSEEKRAIMAITRILGSGTLDGESLRLLEQLADCIQRPQAEVLQEAEPAKQVAAREAREQETSASGQLTAPEAAGRRETKEPCPMETAESTGARDINVPEKETAAVRRDNEPLISEVQERRQEKAAAEKHQAAAGEQPPPPVREGKEPVTSSANDPKTGIMQPSRHGRMPAQNGKSQLGLNPAHRSVTPG